MEWRNPAAERVGAALQDPLFFAICILVSITAGLSLLGGGMVPLILFTVFLWMVYSKAKKGMVSFKAIRNVSGTLFGCFISNFVVYACLVFLGFFWSIFANILTMNSDYFNLFMETYREIAPEYADALTVLLRIPGAVIILICIIAAGCGVLFNFLGMKKIWRFVRSVYRGIASCNPSFEDPKGTAGWLIAYGVFAAVTALICLPFGGGIWSALTNIGIAVVEFMAAGLIRKWFAA